MSEKETKANQNEESFVVVPKPAPLTIEQLFQLFIEAQKDQAKANEKLAEALENSRKPYIDPRVVAEMEQRRKDREALVNLTMRQRAYAKRACPHLNDGGKPNIKWMQHSNGIILGVCGTCQSQFDATHNRDDAKLLMQDPNSLRWMGRAGDHAKKGVDIAV